MKLLHIDACVLGANPAFRRLAAAATDIRSLTRRPTNDALATAVA